MAKYAGMTYDDIINFATRISEKNKIPISHSEAVALIDEALMHVARDVNNPETILTISWPSNDQADLFSNGIYILREAFGDYTPLVYIPYSDFASLFLGGSSLKATGDMNHYYTVNGTVMYVEPGVTGFTNLILKGIAYVTKYNDRASVGNVPEIAPDYRYLVSYKIMELAYPGIFEQLYNRELKKALTARGLRNSSGQAVFWDPFLGSDYGRK